MEKRVQCPRCGSSNTKLLLSTTSKDLHSKFRIILSGSNSSWGDLLYEGNNCDLEWNRSEELKKE
jgi:hypothetical protein